ncbi:MAG: hypothetical protein WDO74_25430 [Pseudomonadota bacterium]
MSRSMPTTRAVIPAFLLLAVAASCGHTAATEDAYNNAKKTGVSNGNTGNTPGNDGGTGNSGGSGNTGNLTQFACTTVASQQFDKDYMAAYSEPAGTAQLVEETLNTMDNAGKASQMIGIPVGGMDWFDIERSPDFEVKGLGKTIRGYNYRDAGRGVNLDAGQPNNRQTDNNDFATVFPAASIRAASWDMALEKEVGAASGDETAASLNNMLLAPCMNIIRHPYWGRTQETYGRGHVSHRPYGNGVHRRLATVRDRVRQALRGQQRREEPLLARRDHERADAARDLRPSLRDGRAGRRRGLHHGVVQQDSTASRTRKTSTCCAIS